MQYEEIKKTPALTSFEMFSAHVLILKQVIISSYEYSLWVYYQETPECYRIKCLNLMTNLI